MTCPNPSCENCYPRAAALRAELERLRAIVSDLAGYVAVWPDPLHALIARARAATPQTQENP